MESISINIKPIKIGSFDKMLPTRYQIQKIKPNVADEHVIYDNAEKLAKEVPFNNQKIVNAIINGSFIFGDFIEAFVVENDFHVKKMTISTLSMSPENVDSLDNLLKWELVDSLDLIISGLQFSMKRNSIVRYTYEVLDVYDKFQIAIADCHTKICCIETHCGEYITIKGSANLCSSGCIEEFSIIPNQETYQFYFDYHQRIIEKFATIKKHIRGNELWKAVSGIDRNELRKKANTKKKTN